MAAARIGRIRMKNIVPIRGAVICDDRKAAFLDHVAGAFDSYLGLTGEKPDAIVLVLGGLKQQARPSWTVRADSEGGATTMLALAQAAIQREIGS